MTSVTTDPVALNQWIPCTFMGQVAPGAHRDTVLLGQPVRVSRDADGRHTCRELVDGAEGRELPIQERYEIVFAALGGDPRALPEIAEYDEPDRKIANVGSVSVRTSPFRLIENFLDMAHFCFVHTDILGSPEQTEVLAYKCETRRDVDEVWATDCRFYQPAASKSATGETGGGMTVHYKYRVMSPFSVMLYKTVYGQEHRDDAIAVFIQPRTETDCLAYMTMALVDDSSSLAELVDFQQTIFLQDRIILENQRPRLLSLAPGKELPTKADLSSMAFRRWLKRMGITFGTLREAV